MREMPDNETAHQRAARLYRERHKAKGLCCNCSDKATVGVRCKRHHRKHLAYHRKKNGVKKHYKKKRFGKMV